MSDGAGTTEWWRELPRTRWLAALLGAEIAAMLATAAWAPLSDPDVWWVAAAGRETLGQGRVIDANLFSFTEPEHPWVMHEWLLGPPYAWLLGRGGAAAFSLVALAAGAVGVGWVVARLVGDARHRRVGLVAAGVVLALFGTRFLSARPMGVAMLLVIGAQGLAWRQRFGPRQAAAAVALEALWASVHGSFPLGLVLLAAGSLDRRRDPGWRALALAAAALVTLANPYGIHLHSLVAGYLTGGADGGIHAEIHRHIVEFRPVWRVMHERGYERDAWACLLLAAAAAGGLAVPGLRVRAGLALALAALAARSVRHLELAGVLGAVLLQPALDRAADRLWPAPGEPGPRPGDRRRWVAGLLAPGLAAALVAHAHARSTRSPLGWIGPGRAVAARVSEWPDGARVLVPFAAAGVALWYGFPRGVRVAFDPRNDCYSAPTARRFFALDQGTDPDPLAALRDWRVDRVLVPPSHPLVPALAGAPGWSLARLPSGWLEFAAASVPLSSPRAPAIGDDGGRTSMELTPELLRSLLRFATLELTMATWWCPDGGPPRAERPLDACFHVGGGSFSYLGRGSCHDGALDDAGLERLVTAARAAVDEEQRSWGVDTADGRILTRLTLSLHDVRPERPSRRVASLELNHHVRLRERQPAWSTLVQAVGDTVGARLDERDAGRWPLVLDRLGAGDRLPAYLAGQAERCPDDSLLLMPFEGSLFVRLGQSAGATALLELRREPGAITVLRHDGGERVLDRVIRPDGGAVAVRTSDELLAAAEQVSRHAYRGAAGPGADLDALRGDGRTQFRLLIDEALRVALDVRRPTLGLYAQRR